MTYLDTSLIVAFGFREEVNHERARRCVEELLSKGEAFIISPFTLAELYAVLSRLSKVEYVPPPPFPRLFEGDEGRTELCVRYLLRLLRLKVAEDEATLESYAGKAMFKKFSEAINVSRKLAGRHRLGCGDLIHVSYAAQLGEALATLDDRFGEVAEEILERLRVEIILA